MWFLWSKPFSEQLVFTSLIKPNPCNTGKFKWTVKGKNSLIMLYEEKNKISVWKMVSVLPFRQHHVQENWGSLFSSISASCGGTCWYLIFEVYMRITWICGFYVKSCSLLGPLMGSLHLTQPPVLMETWGSSLYHLLSNSIWNGFLCGAETGATCTVQWKSIWWGVFSFLGKPG